MKSFLLTLLVFASLFCNAQTLSFAMVHASLPLHADDSTFKFTSDGVAKEPAKAKESAVDVPPAAYNRGSKVRTLIVPAALISYGIIALNNDKLRKFDWTTKERIAEGTHEFKSRVDDYLQYAPALAVYGLDAIGVKSRNNLADRSIMYLATAALTGVVVSSMKPLASVKRPDGSATNSFPSGHTTSAFAAAEFLHQEYKHSSPFISIAGYAAATATGVLRMYNNRHFLSDVVCGAGLGMLSTKLVYLAYPAVKRKISKRKTKTVLP
jgi:hypothetical protein